MREDVKTNGKGSFWKAMPPRLLEWQGRFASATNKLHEFLSMDPDERGCTIRRVEGHVTWLSDLKTEFVRCMHGDRWDPDPSVFTAFGFRLSDNRENVCMTCKQITKGQRGRCCMDYDITKRLKKIVVADMMLTTNPNAIKGVHSKTLLSSE